MQPRSRRLCAVLVAAGLLAPCSGPLAQRNQARTLAPAPVLRGTLTAGGVRYAVGNPEMIVGSAVREVLVSPDGRYMLAARITRDLAAAGAAGTPDDAPGEASLVCWNTRNGRVRTVWNRPLAPTMRYLLGFRLSGWMGRSGTALAYAPVPRPEELKPGEGRSLFLLVDAAQGRTREIPAPPDSFSVLSPSPELPYAALFQGADAANDEEIRFLRPDGTITGPAPLPGTVFFNGWSPDGREIWGLDLGDKAKGRPKGWYAVDPVSLKTRPIPAVKTKERNSSDYWESDSFTDNGRLPLRLELEGERYKPGRVVLKAADGDASLVLCAEGEPIGLLPDGSAALYRSAGALYAVRIVAVPASPATAPRPSP